MIWDSFFDDIEGQEHKTYSMWKKNIDKNDYEVIKDPSKIVFEGSLSKFDKEKGKHTQYYFVLTKDRLYYLKVSVNVTRKKAILI